MAKVVVNNLSPEITLEELAIIEDAEKMPIVFDEVCPEMTSEMLEQFHKMDVVTQKTPSNMKNVKSLDSEYTGSSLKYPGWKGTVNMCLAIQQMREESKIKGSVEAYKDVGISLVETIKRIAERFGLSESESSEVVKQMLLIRMLDKGIDNMEA